MMSQLQTVLQLDQETALLPLTPKVASATMVKIFGLTHMKQVVFAPAPKCVIVTNLPA
jgi:hypothetical protein